MREKESKKDKEEERSSDPSSCAEALSSPQAMGKSERLRSSADVALLNQACAGAHTTTTTRGPDGDVVSAGAHDADAGDARKVHTVATRQGHAHVVGC